MSILRTLGFFLAVGFLLVPAASADGGSVKVLDESQMMSTWIAVKPQVGESLPPGSRIVVSRVVGSLGGADCAQAVKDALFRRLIDNGRYTVLSRDDLELILFEGDESWGGRFNTQTAPKLGELLGAGYFIVGRVSYCGPTVRKRADGEWESLFSLFATLQVIDSATAEVVFASASEGSAIRPPESLSLATEEQPGYESASVDQAGEKKGFWRSISAADVVETVSDVKDKRSQRLLGRVMGKTLKGQPEESVGSGSEEEPLKPYGRGEFDDYLIIRAADSMVDKFADKLFGRPLWERVEMWSSKRWRYGDSAYLVKLGDCPRAVALLEGSAALQTDEMTPHDVAEYLHNYGVALLCVGEVEPALRKLRSAYRIDGHKSTLAMLGLAARMEEWSLVTEVDEGAEIKRVREEDTYFGSTVRNVAMEAAGGSQP